MIWKLLSLKQFTSGEHRQLDHRTAVMPEKEPSAQFTEHINRMARNQTYTFCNFDGLGTFSVIVLQLPIPVFFWQKDC